MFKETKPLTYTFFTSVNVTIIENDHDIEFTNPTKSISNSFKRADNLPSLES